MLSMMTARIMPRDESRPLGRNDIIADLAFAFAIGFYAMPQILKNYRVALAYQASLAIGFGALLYNACDRCGNDFCPMKDLRNAILRMKE
jgi:hypothetical protein